MQFWASAEVDRPAVENMYKARLKVEPFLNKAFSATSLATLECLLRYVPIIMPKEMHERYTARSRLRRKDRIYDCAPQLDFDVFVSGTFEEQLDEYIRGIALSTHRLKDLGASPEQIKDFETILAGATQRILAEN